MNIGKYRHQTPDQVVDISDWSFDEPAYQEGARDKSTVFSPDKVEFEFLRPNHRYLAKQSRRSYPHQFWMEVIAYRLGALCGVEVPPCFVAIDKFGNNVALIEWFYNDWDTGSHEYSYYLSGYQVLSTLDKELDKEKGLRHTISTIIKMFSLYLQLPAMYSQEGFEDSVVEQIVTGVARIPFQFVELIVFDAIIANTDRHHENWGVLFDVYKTDEKPVIAPSRLSPAFDNGTSLGSNYLDSKLQNYIAQPGWFERFAEKGKHHIRKDFDGEQFGHTELVKFFLDEEVRDGTGGENDEATYNDLIYLMTSITTFDLNEVKKLLLELTRFKVKVPFTEQRAEFTIKIIEAKQKALLRAIDELRFKKNS